MIRVYYKDMFGLNYITARDMENAEQIKNKLEQASFEEVTIEEEKI